MRVLLAGILPTVLAVSPATGQDRPGAPPPEPRTLVGIVTDTAGRALDSAEVRVMSVRRSAFTRDDGTFTFENTRPARYTVTARKDGYLPQSRDVVVGSAGAAVRFELVPFVFGLPAAVTVVTRTGISGIVADTLHRPIAGATVHIIGSTRQVTTDSAGAFYVDATPGRYVVRVRHAGYRTQIASVTLPEHEGRRVAVWLHESRLADRVRDNVAAFDFNARLVARNPAWSRLFTREDLAEFGPDDLNRLASVGAVQRVDENCEAIIDGGPWTAPMWSINTSELEFVEVYAHRPSRRTATSILAGANSAARATAQSNAATFACNATVYAWFRK